MSFIHSYIEKELLHKSLGTYFRRGKWILHVLFVLLFLSVFLLKYTKGIKDLQADTVLLALSLALPFLVFFYIYCLYLIPYCFKRNRYKRFWLLLLALLVLFPFIDYELQWLALPKLPKLRENLEGYEPWFIIGSIYSNFVSSFVGFTSLLYFMELLENVNINKETAAYRKELASTELHRIKTQMNPEFMTRSLDGIIQLADKADSNAPAAVIDFSDVLRYRLYRSKERLVALEDELAQLHNLFSFHNALPGRQGTATLEREGGPLEGAQVVPLSLINIAEPLLATFRPNSGWSVLMYLLIEDREIQVAIELTAPAEAGIEARTERIRLELEQLLYSGLNFTSEKELNNHSLRTCIPIIRHSTALS